MNLREAKQFLNEKGYELLDEGKFGRALAAGALALGLATGNANAFNKDDIDRFEKQTEEQIQNRSYVGDRTWIEIVNLNNNTLKIKKEYNGGALEIISKFSPNTLDYIVQDLIKKTRSGTDWIWRFRLSEYAKEYRYDKNGEIVEVIIYKDGNEINRLKN
jgi:hypothetical protein